MAVVIEVQFGSTLRTIYFLKQQTIKIRWCTFLVGVVRSVARLIDYKICGPSGNRINYCNQKDDGVTFSCWRARQAYENSKQDCIWFSQ